jgi:hypothetical protein
VRLWTVPVGAVVLVTVIGPVVALAGTVAFTSPDERVGDVAARWYGGPCLPRASGRVGTGHATAVVAAAFPSFQPSAALCAVW